MKAPKEIAFDKVPCRVDGADVATVEIDEHVVKVRPRGSSLYVVTLGEMAEMVCWRSAKQRVAAAAGTKVKRR